MFKELNAAQPNGIPLTYLGENVEEFNGEKNGTSSTSLKSVSFVNSKNKSVVKAKSRTSKFSQV